MRRTAAEALALMSACVLSPVDLSAQSAGDSLRVSFGAFVDAYYAYDFGQPGTLDRAFTTQAARHAEFNVNLAHIDARFEGIRLRGRVAAQFGTSVQANYAAEPRVGMLSGPDVSRFIQEAVVGYRVAPRLWIDAGVYLAPFGPESWISSENWTYTRSLIADNSPYYASGVRATWQAAPQLSAQLHVMNGWQNISETNDDKALAVRLDYSPVSRVSLAYDAFVGNEQPDTLPAARRAFQEVLVRVRVNDRLEVAGAADYGTQRLTHAAAGGVWRGWAALARYRLARIVWVAGRAEGYSDPHQIIVTTGRGHGLRATASSLTIDVAPQPALLWRVEFRNLRSKEPLFVDSRDGDRLSKHNVVLVSSFSFRVN